MKNSFNNRNRNIKTTFFSAFLLLACLSGKSQTLVTDPLNQPGTSGAHYNYTSIVLSPGFSSGANFHAYILQAPVANCVPLNLNLSTSNNYIVSYTPRSPYINGADLPNQDICKVNVSVQYFDGLGRPLQTVQVKGNNDASKDLVQPVEYDPFGREAKKFLPYTSTTADGSYKTDAFTAQSTFYSLSNPTPPTGVKQNAFPFSQTIFESSPLNRVQQQGAPGADWQPVINSTTGHTMKMEYGSNTTDEVRLWEVTANGATGTNYYGANELYKTTTKDENWKEVNGKAGTTEEFKDKEGRVVLKKVWETDAKSLSTYYVYDDLGNLRSVLPPAVNENGQANLSSFTEGDTNFNNFIYGYRYDGRRRLIEKKIPGKGWEYMIYNNLDQVVLTQDAIQRVAYKWIYSKYDALGRPVVSGMYTNATVTDRLAMQQLVDNETNLAVNNPVKPLWENRVTTGQGYSDEAFPRAAASYLTINYYDDYDFPGNTFGAQSSSQSDKVHGMPTGSKINILGTSSMLLSVMYYDTKGRVLQSKAQHYLSGAVDNSNYDETTNEWNFDGSLKTSKREHHVGSVITTIANRYEYDHVGRKKESYENIYTSPATDGTEVLLSALDYNEIGQLKEKKLHNNLQSTQYAYNERGWLKSQSSPQFSMSLNYQDGTTPQYNGNISNQLWGAGSTFPNTFNYEYDKLNRLTNASSTGVSMIEALSYDVMGNISTLSRDGGTAGTYNYAGNQLNGISNGPLATGTYAYDVNGNVTTDGRNNKTITYNVLNLPQTISGGISYTYDATGTKLKKVSTAATDYIKGIEYENNQISIIHTEEGIARRSGSSYNYEYNLSDHLGNVRYTFYKNPNTGQLERLQSDDYYAFGLRKSVSPVSLNNKYLYNGKELQEELGQYDYGARFYDPVIGRWNVVDPLAEFYDDVSPYNYALNNPARFVDPDGMGVADSVKKPEPKPIQLKEVKITAKNPAGAILKAGMMGALVVSQLDSPLPGPGDVAGVGIAAGTLISAGVAWIGYEIYSNYKSHTVNSKKYEKGDKLPTPESEPGKFNKKRGSQGWENTETGEVYQKSHTSHGNKNNEGTQWKVWPKGTTDFGPNSKKSGERTTLDQNGVVIGD